MKQAQMKKSILFLLLAVSGMAQAQSLKDLLYSGKLKSMPGVVIRKGDDLSKFIDTSAKAPAPAVAVAPTAPGVPATTTTSATAGTTTRPAAAANNTGTAATGTTAGETAQTTETTATENTTTETAAAPAPAPAPEKPKDNNALMKDYMASVLATVKGEGLTNKKIKKGTYYGTLSYTIETDGGVTVTDILLTPENDVLKKQIKERIDAEAPKLTPVVNSAGVARKLQRKYNFNITKE
ncbi:hypothetical protein SAMN05444008_11873 [Cnuella takakiae]|uniref:Uncharacterized protein n=1 Tax=Cnuella takakiae TaxID=1302690 RepID=A0A1M5H833_9BACT|nr:hypothetical protein [Cnuella takakiae]OLY91074.1 hypothetical protein BUE76_03535 [Cnuella takakiae]SHG12189.1 hypothetical protein SAMN05444008_11873 [Cnuella takakiae]